MILTFFIGSIYGGGAERVTCNLASYLVQHGHDVEILTFSETEKKYELDARVRVKTLLPLQKRKGKLWNNVVRLPEFWKYLLKTKTDAYVVMLPKTIILLLMFRWMTKAKIICSERVDPAAYSTALAFLLKHYASKADGFVFQTEDPRKWYGKSVKKIKTMVIPNAINPLFLRPAYKGKKQKIIAGVGRLIDQKNFSLLIRAFHMISKDFPEYNLVIYGEGSKRKELENLVSEAGLSDRISLPGNIKNIPDKLEQVSLFVLSSDFEGMPNALMEAMALGLPCISTDCPCGGPRFLICHGLNGILVPVGNVNAMADAMRKMLLDFDNAQKMGKKAAEIQMKLSPDKVYDQWNSFIHHVLE